MQLLMTIRILMVDDDADLANFSKVLLERQSITCDIAPSGEDGLTMLSNGNYDACLLDFDLPGMNGLQVLSEIHKICACVKWKATFGSNVST